ncbi:ABC transporter substrate-binding protein [archaeon]|jgi:NitT/TauT family transport system substrate-binding protein|nr:ABC transporter substrate-binding protein [archaeon]MBT7001895.1 ABC transporter substrate-binding protein [archaeon]
MKNTKIIIPVLIIILIIGAFFVLFPKQNETEIVKVGYLPILGSLPLYVAQENNYFEEQGIQIEAIQVQSSNQLLEALIRGDIDIGVISALSPVIIAESIDPNKMKIFTTTKNQINVEAIIVLNDSGISTVKDLEGKKIGVFPGSFGISTIKKSFTNRGINVDKIEFVQIAPQNQLEALMSGSIDALNAMEPIKTIAINNGNVVKIFDSVTEDVLKNNPNGVSLINTNFLSESPETAKEVMRIIEKSFRYIEENDEDIRTNIIPKYLKLNSEVSNKVVIIPQYTSEDINKEVVQDYAELMLEFGEISKRVNTSNMFHTQN